MTRLYRGYLLETIKSMRIRKGKPIANARNAVRLYLPRCRPIIAMQTYNEDEQVIRR